MYTDPSSTPLQSGVSSNGASAEWSALALRHQQLEAQHAAAQAQLLQMQYHQDQLHRLQRQQQQQQQEQDWIAWQQVQSQQAAHHLQQHQLDGHLLRSLCLAPPPPPPAPHPLHHDSPILMPMPLPQSLHHMPMQPLPQSLPVHRPLAAHVALLPTKTHTYTGPLPLCPQPQPPSASSASPLSSSGPAASSSSSPSPPLTTPFQVMDLASLEPGTSVQTPSWTYSVPLTKKLRGGGVSCHHCKATKTKEQLYFCTNMSKSSIHRKMCHKKFCAHCLQRLYPDHLPRADDDAWLCPSCLALCHCLACTTSRESTKEQTVRLLVRAAELQGAFRVKRETTKSPFSSNTSIATSVAAADANAHLPPDTLTVSSPAPPALPPSDDFSAFGASAHSSLSYTPTPSLPGSVCSSAASSLASTPAQSPAIGAFGSKKRGRFPMSTTTTLLGVPTPAITISAEEKTRLDAVQQVMLTLHQVVQRAREHEFPPPPPLQQQVLNRAVPFSAPVATLASAPLSSSGTSAVGSFVFASPLVSVSRTPPPHSPSPQPLVAPLGATLTTAQILAQRTALEHQLALVQAQRASSEDVATASNGGASQWAHLQTAASVSALLPSAAAAAAINVTSATVLRTSFSRSSLHSSRGSSAVTSPAFGSFHSSAVTSPNLASFRSSGCPSGVRSSAGSSAVTSPHLGAWASCSRRVSTEQQHEQQQQQSHEATTAPPHPPSQHQQMQHAHIYPHTTPALCRSLHPQKTHMEVISGDGPTSHDEVPLPDAPPSATTPTSGTADAPATKRSRLCGVHDDDAATTALDGSSHSAPMISHHLCGSEDAPADFDLPADQEQDAMRDHELSSYLALLQSPRRAQD